MVVICVIVDLVDGYTHGDLTRFCMAVLHTNPQAVQLLGKATFSHVVYERFWGEYGRYYVAESIGGEWVAQIEFGVEIISIY